MLFVDRLGDRLANSFFARPLRSGLVGVVTLDWFGTWQRVSDVNQEILLAATDGIRGVDQLEPDRHGVAVAPDKSRENPAAVSWTVT
ncbi:hypothetical protein [Enhygromyxa salina]|uniref:Uncharacterized protein n=1 Tax=Enhygromyxa salina TaxID=215803 RepID=A0A2S9YKI7_9BACT|nr:hypothetical protein [Enhygromyxa salina]PRQ05603.1 hypothetical protein ENSA7_44930 [Enhygromyxa salina]